MRTAPGDGTAAGTAGRDRRWPQAKTCVRVIAMSALAGAAALGTLGQLTGWIASRPMLVVAMSLLVAGIGAVKLGLYPCDAGHRRVLAVLSYLGA